MLYKVEESSVYVYDAQRLIASFDLKDVKMEYNKFVSEIGIYVYCRKHFKKGFKTIFWFDLKYDTWEVLE